MERTEVTGAGANGSGRTVPPPAGRRAAPARPARPARPRAAPASGAEPNDHRRPRSDGRRGGCGGEPGTRRPEKGDDRGQDCTGRTADSSGARSTSSVEDQLVREGDVAGDYLERLLDVLDYDGDIDLDVEAGRAIVSIDGGDDLDKLAVAMSAPERPPTRTR